MSKPQIYLNIQEQQEIINKLTAITFYAPAREKLFFEHGDKFALSALMGSSVVFWRCGFRAFNLNKFNRSRLSTLLMSCLSSFNGVLVHKMLVRSTLTDFYRPENMWSYGIRSAVAHQFGLAASLLAGTGFTFFCAQRIGIIPIPNNVHRAGVRGLAFNYFITRLKPYAKTIAVTCLASSGLMFMVGLCEYKQSRTLLARINRKTLSLKEDD